MHRLIAISAILLLAAATLFQGRVRLSQFAIDELNGDFAVSWQTDIEEQVHAFELLRRTPNSNNEFVLVQSMDAHGVNKPYRFTDTQVYKSGSDKLDYRLDVVYADGVRETLRSQSLNYASTAVRRTWGSLKAMFQ
ncbi:MAG: hypothetical protein HKN17_01140 [Rhodothermales bacterium]|nr:hypothetical protein [Rhodothermales bacterium]